jgi:hypothetical protein
VTSAADQGSEEAPIASMRMTTLSPDFGTGFIDARVSGAFNVVVRVNVRF